MLNLISVLSFGTPNALVCRALDPNPNIASLKGVVLVPPCLKCKALQNLDVDVSSFLHDRLRYALSLSGHCAASGCVFVVPLRREVHRQELHTARRTRTSYSRLCVGCIWSFGHVHCCLACCFRTDGLLFAAQLEGMRRGALLTAYDRANAGRLRKVISSRP